MIWAQLLWTDKYGAGRFEQGQAYRLAQKLKTLRAPAELWLIDENNEKTEIIGGCERLDAGTADDKRLKWNWWYDKTAVGEIA